MTLGLIGGLGLGAGLHYYTRIARTYERRDETLQLLLIHADFKKVLAFVEAGRITHLAEYLSSLMTCLADGGATIAALPAVTAHICLDQLCSISPIPIIGLPSALNRKISESGLRRISLFGTRFVVETDCFGYLDAVDVVRPSAQEIGDIDAIYRVLAGTGTGTDGQRLRLAEIADRLIKDERVDSIVLAGTDFCSLYESSGPEFPALDASGVHIDAILKALGRS